jgi:two-component system chemotaxis sensor kinase CheA
VSRASIDRTRVEPWLDQAAEAAASLADGDQGAADRLRSALQGLALVDGLPAEFARDVMRIARSMLEASADGATPEHWAEQYAIVQSSIAGLLGAADEVHSGAAAAAAPAPRAADERRAAPAAVAASTRSMPVPNDPLVGDFVNECEEHLQTAEEALLELETDATSTEHLGAIFRCFHTIKGGAGLLGLDAVAELAHAAEFLLDRARSGAIAIQGESAEACYGVLDTFRSLLSAVGSGVAAVPVPAVFDDQLRELARLTAGGHAPGASASRAPAAAANHDDDSAAGSEASDHVSAGEARTGEAPRAAADSNDASERKRDGAKPSVKVDTDRLDKMIDLVGELVITNAIVGQEVARDIPTHDPRQRVLAQLAKVTNELQSVSMSMRMVPLKGTFQKATRIVRDVAAKCGKQVRLVTRGEETELDRNVVERLSDPLIHMLRNAVDHGVESAERRRAAGKPPVGTIELAAEHRAGNVVIELSDDGGGIPREKILAKAVAQGIVAADAAASLPDVEVWNLIFHPGLSTAEKLTDVSGRGVGMDVVRKNIEALRGTVAIDSTPGRGSRFTIRLPLTLAIIDGMVIEVAGRALIVPMQSIDGFVSPSADKLKSVKGEGEVAILRGEPVPVHRIGRLLGDGLEPEGTEQLLALVWARGRKVALRIDRIRGQQQVVVKSLSNTLCRAPFVSGAAILGDGSVGLVVDVDTLVAACTGSHRLNLVAS